jgi:hypothetical protein
MPSTAVLRFVNDRVRNVGYSHFRTLRLANFAQRFLVADAFCCGGKGFTAYRYIRETDSWSTDIAWR